MNKNRRFAGLLSAFLILSLSCGPLGQAAATQSVGQKKASPASPTAPAAVKPTSTTQVTPEVQSKYREVSPVPPTLPAPPKPILAPEGTPDEQALFFADQLASGKEHLAVWMGVYDALGVPVIGQDGAPLGSTGDDPIGPRFWQVWYASGLDLPGRAIQLQDVGRLFVEGLPELDGAAVGDLLLADLRTAAQSKTAQVRLLGLFVRERILRGPAQVDILDAAVSPDTARIDLPTVQLISWVIVRSVLLQTASLTSAPEGSISSVDYHPQPAAQPGPQLHCSDLPGAGSTASAWHNFWINKVGGGLQLPGMTDEMAFPSFVELAVGKMMRNGPQDKAERFSKFSGKMLGFVNVFTSAISLIMQLQAMDIEAIMEPEPLIRTHYTTDGNEATIGVRLYSDPKGRPDGDELESCLASYFLNALGVSFSFPTKQNIPGAEIVIEGGKNIPAVVLINEGRMRFMTGADGQVNIHVIGKAQRKTIPDSAPPVAKEFSIKFSAQPEEAGLGSMLNIFFGGLGGLANAAAFLSSLIDILKTFHYDMGEKVFMVTDWGSQGWKVDEYQIWPWARVHFTGLSCKSPYGPWEINISPSGEGLIPGGQISGEIHIPFAENGKALGTIKEQATHIDQYFAAEGSLDSKITPVNGNYLLYLERMTITYRGVVGKQKYTKTETGPGYMFQIIPAEEGDCPQP